MTKKYRKWRDLSVDPYQIPFKKIKIVEVINYFPAGNDVIECKCIIEAEIKNAVIKIERSRMANFQSEIESIQRLSSVKLIKVPKIIEICEVDNKVVIALEKIKGNRLSDIFKATISVKDDYLIKYGQELSKIHSLSLNDLKIAKQRPINDYPKLEDYPNCHTDYFIKKYINWLKNNKPNIDFDCFIHGDFHYANVLWYRKKVSGILDFEYSGKGFKEQDIAWSIILRPNQTFMDNKLDIDYFLKGYKIKGVFDYSKLKWCLLNGYCHFYLMNYSNKEYINKIKDLILHLMENDLI